MIVGAACASSRHPSSSGEPSGQPYLSESIDIHDGLGKAPAGPLEADRATNPSVNDAVCIFARVLLLAIGRVVRIMRSAIGITFKGDRRHRVMNTEARAIPPLSRSSYFPLAVDEAQSPAEIVDHDGDIVRVVETMPRFAIQICAIVEGPFGGSKPPNEFPKISSDHLS